MPKKLTTEIFIQKSILIHGDKYDYSLVDYIDSHTKIKIICPLHGIFEHKPNWHLNGVSCRGCSDELKFNKRRMDNKVFIERSRLIHGDKYGYTKTEYHNARTKVNITCKKHGDFKQKPQHHMNGSGCPICKSSKGEIEIQKFLTTNDIKFIKEHKFDGCFDVKKLPFDFYLPELNICIEYDGIQHFNPNHFFGGFSYHTKLKRHDEIKTLYCINNKINIIRIRYNENVVEKLSPILF
jgi:hypothetical protein